MMQQEILTPPNSGTWVHECQKTKCEYCRLMAQIPTRNTKDRIYLLEKLASGK